jgi:hypothetical protein
MIHNGIEYGMMQALAEGFDIMRNAASQALPAEERLDLDLGEIAEAWRRGSVITSWLLDLTAAALWVFADERWLVLDGAGDYVDRERRTLRAEPVVVKAFGDALDRASKIVGVSRDLARLADCEAACAQLWATALRTARSQPYYLDVTPPGVDKGTMVAALGRRLEIGSEAIATIGDMENDVPMFARSGMSVAMGNADARREGASPGGHNLERGGRLRPGHGALRARRSTELKRPGRSAPA